MDFLLLNSLSYMADAYRLRYALTANGTMLSADNNVKQVAPYQTT